MKKVFIFTTLFMLFGLAVTAQALYFQPTPVIYAAANNGHLIWYSHPGYTTGAPIPAGKTIGFGGWQYYKSVFANGKIIYGVTADGNLNWYRYEDSQGGNTEITGAKTVGRGGWNQYKSVFGGGNGIIYAITTDGNLLWYKYPNEPYGDLEVFGGRVIARGGWEEYTAVFSGGNGIIYAVDTNGNLYWYKHLGAESGAAEWEGGGRKTIATGGWQIYKFLFSGGYGTIYGVGTDGNLYWYNHQGHYSGEPTITANSRLKIGTGGWGDFLYVLAGQ